VTQGGGGVPSVRAKWETPDDDPTISYTQVNPPLVYGACKEVCVWAVVFDEEDKGAVAQVLVDVWHPEGEPDNGSVKYDNLSASVLDFDAGLAAFDLYKTKSIIKYFDSWTESIVRTNLVEGKARVWKVCFQMHYCQPAGDYGVGVKAIDKSGNVSTVVAFNRFTYVAKTGFEIDFTNVTYPPVSIGQEVMKDGDTTFGSAEAPTIRNLSNVNVLVSVRQNDMGFGRYADGVSGYQGWKVSFDARLGPQVDNADSTHVYYAPDATTQLPNKLYLCQTNKLDFSIKLWYGLPSTTPYTGTMVISVAGTGWDAGQPQVNPVACIP
jgi:hypothetical protein